MSIKAIGALADVLGVPRATWKHVPEGQKARWLAANPIVEPSELTIIDMENSPNVPDYAAADFIDVARLASQQIPRPGGKFAFWNLVDSRYPFVSVSDYSKAVVLSYSKQQWNLGGMAELDQFIIKNYRSPTPAWPGPLIAYNSDIWIAVDLNALKDATEAAGMIAPLRSAQRNGYSILFVTQKAPDLWQPDYWKARVIVDGLD